MPAPADREKALDAALAAIDKNFGKGSVMRLGDEVRPPIEVIPTGSIALDVALGIGGLPRGRVVEIYGPESSGKTTVALHAVASAQKAGGIAAFIDAEHALDPDYAAKLGVDTDALLVSQPDTGEQALEIADMLIRSGALDIIVIDSVAALVPKAEIEGEMGDSHVGLQARLMSQALRKITGALNHSGTTAIFINQLREKIGVMFGSPETTTGGKALKFYASVRLDVRRIETLKDGTNAVGNRTRVKVVKNKVSPPFKQAEFDIIYGQGISREGGLIDLGVEHGFVRKSGAWYTYEGDQLGQGKENARAFLRDNPDLGDEIEKRIKEKLGIGARLDAPAEVARGEGRLLSRSREQVPPGPDENPDREADPREVARAIALRQLTMAPRTRKQLAEKLAAKEVPAEVALEVLDRFEEVGLVDDKAFAQGWVHSRSSGRGRRALAQELRTQGRRRRDRRRRAGGRRPRQPGRGRPRAGASQAALHGRAGTRGPGAAAVRPAGPAGVPHRRGAPGRPRGARGAGVTSVRDHHRDPGTHPQAREPRRRPGHPHRDPRGHPRLRGQPRLRGPVRRRRRDPRLHRRAVGVDRERQRLPRLPRHPRGREPTRDDHHGPQAHPLHGARRHLMVPTGGQTWPPVSSIPSSRGPLAFERPVPDIRRWTSFATCSSTMLMTM